ncbi:hypothetical protein PAV_4c04890 [Paenibacillus alvei DSM 29]|nr:hypothetical protein PAV_4c04890 [Paenibacillus alvei DSM 29]
MQRRYVVGIVALCAAVLVIPLLWAPDRHPEPKGMTTAAHEESIKNKFCIRMLPVQAACSPLIPDAIWKMPLLIGEMGLQLKNKKPFSNL